MRSRASHAQRGLWLYYTDDSGSRHAQPDIIIKEPNYVRLYEVKLTSNCRAAHNQILRYAALLEHLWGLPVQPVHVYKWSESTQADVIGASCDALRLRADKILEWHYLG